MSQRQRKKISKHEAAIKLLSNRLVDAQRPIHILDSIKWNDQIKQDFFKHKFKKLPAVHKNFYLQNNLNFDPDELFNEFYIIEHEVKRILGSYGAASQLLQHRCREYRDVISLLKARGTKEFSELSKGLYGSAQDAFYEEAPTLQDLSELISGVLENIGGKTVSDIDTKIYSAEDAAKILSKRLRKYFGRDHKKIHVEASDQIISDAAAGADSIKLRSDTIFSERVLRLYEVHEGWVHLGTTLNGLKQPICTFLSKGTPSCTITQEGLAMLMELFTFTSYPNRVRRITDRIVAINMAEAGANFIDIFNFFREQDSTEDESYYNTVRVFRGSLPDLGPFTKDLSYSKGFVSILNYIRLSVQRGNLDHIPLLFLGKINLSEIHLLAELIEDKIVQRPKYLPPQFKDLSGISALMGYLIFISQLDTEALAKSYQDIL